MLYLNIRGRQKGPGKFSWRPGKSLIFHQ